jgi:hypothetical protein
MNIPAVPTMSRGCPTPYRDNLGTPTGHPQNNPEIDSNPQADTESWTRGTPGTPTPTGWDHQRRICNGRWPGWVCAATLNPHNVTGLCGECKFILRNERMSSTKADPATFVTYTEAEANIAAVLGLPLTELSI